MKTYVKQLFLDSNGVASITRLWSHVAYGTATWVLIHLTLSEKFNEFAFLVYLGVVGGSALASKIVTAKYPGGTPNAPAPPAP